MKELEYYGEKFCAKVCPCCGGEAKFDFVQRDTPYVNSIVAVFVKCDKCGLRTRNVSVSPAYSAIGVAVDLWNKREE